MNVEEIAELVESLENVARLAGHCEHPDKHLALVCKRSVHGFVWIRTARASGPLPERTFVMPRERVLAFLKENDARRQQGRQEKAKSSLSVSHS